MAEQKLPYMNAYGNIPKALNKITTAATPDRFTQDFLATKLALKGGSAAPVIPFLKRIGFLGSDGVPTELYRRYRNPAESRRAVAQALKIGYAPLYQLNEYAHELSDKELVGLIVQLTGSEADSKVVRAIAGSFKALKDFASFDEQLDADGTTKAADREDAELPQKRPMAAQRLGLSYTINLQLPATSDISVFDAIFKSLREHLLRD